MSFPILFLINIDRALNVLIFWRDLSTRSVTNREHIMWD